MLSLYISHRDFLWVAENAETGVNTSLHSSSITAYKRITTDPGGASKRRTNLPKKRQDVVLLVHCPARVDRERMSVVKNALSYLAKCSQKAGKTLQEDLRMPS